MALGASTFSDFGSAVSDLFASSGYKARAAGDLAEEQNYLQAAQFAEQNVQYTEMSTAIKQHQLDREIYKQQSQTQADVAGAGLAQSGSAIDIIREGASQGALSKAVLGQQGLITEAGYQEQAQSYRNMANAAQIAANAENTASTGALITGGIKAAAGLFSLFA